MQPRGLPYKEFIAATVEEYLSGDYGVDKVMAEELAQTEWEIRQQVENAKRLPQGQLKQSNSHAGFGLKGVWLGESPEENARKKVEHKTSRKIKISKTAYKALSTKQVLSVPDVEWLLSGDTDFLPKCAKGLGFPEYETRLKGFKTWKVYDWIQRFSKGMAITVKA